MEKQVEYDPKYSLLFPIFATTLAGYALGAGTWGEERFGKLAYGAVAVVAAVVALLLNRVGCNVPSKSERPAWWVASGMCASIVLCFAVRCLKDRLG
ncbi:MAG TPA: hypothetical protein QGH10_15475 [Armatimonadota bacterium]|nr:hypothetical protein [Armatimonadota bacterium]